MKNCPYDIAELVAHAPPMLLLDRVDCYDDMNICASVTLRDDSPFVRDGVVPAYVCIEYMGQAIAAYSGLQGKVLGHPVRIGFLLGTRNLTLHREYIQVGETVRIEAQSVFNDGEMGAFSCVAQVGGNCVAEGTLNVFQAAQDIEALNK